MYPRTAYRSPGLLVRSSPAFSISDWLNTSSSSASISSSLAREPISYWMVYLWDAMLTSSRGWSTFRVARSIDADHAVRVLDEIVRERGTGPELVRMDNGPEMTANALRDWCRFGGSGRSFIEPGSPWQNPFVESFGSRVRDEVLSVEAFDSLLEAQTVINDWRTIYNHKRPHSSLSWKTPAAYAASLTRPPAEVEARLS